MLFRSILSLTGVPLISESILDTLSPNQTAYYVFSGNPQLNGLNQNQKDDFVCVEAKSSLNPTVNDINYDNNTQCLLLEDAGFSLSDIRPNPAENSIESWLVVGEESEITFEIINMLGESCLIVNRNYTPGTYSIDIDVSHLSAGSYFLWVSSTNNKKIIQFIKIIFR